MALFAALSCAVPLSTVFLPHPDHVHKALGKVIPLFNDGAPGRPHRRLLRNGQHIAKGFQIFLMQLQIAGLFHGIRVCCPLGIDIEHDKRIKSIMQGDPVYGFEGVVQVAGLGSGGIDTDADQRILSPGAQYVTVLGIEIGGIQPLVDIIIGVGRIGGFQRFPECHKLQLRGGSLGDMHITPPGWGTSSSSPGRRSRNLPCVCRSGAARLQRHDP